MTGHAQHVHQHPSGLGKIDAVVQGEGLATSETKQTVRGREVARLKAVQGQIHPRMHQRHTCTVALTIGDPTQLVLKGAGVIPGLKNLIVQVFDVVPQTVPSDACSRRFRLFKQRPCTIRMGAVNGLHGFTKHAIPCRVRLGGLRCTTASVASYERGPEGCDHDHLTKRSATSTQLDRPIAVALPPHRNKVTCPTFSSSLLLPSL